LRVTINDLLAFAQGVRRNKIYRFARVAPSIMSRTTTDFFQTNTSDVCPAKLRRQVPKWKPQVAVRLVVDTQVYPMSIGRPHSEAKSDQVYSAASNALQVKILHGFTALH
jgi:hypothetical protein